ncbi:MAG: hypothetical protein U0586_15045 [Candidatus Brocadiaceae bacterium]
MTWKAYLCQGSVGLQERLSFHVGRQWSSAHNGVGYSWAERGFSPRDGYFSYTKNSRVMLERLASTNPATLACKHGSAWHGDGAKLLRALADALSA